MRHWWLGDRRKVSLDDIAWALGIQSSKTAEVEGSKVFDLYSGREARSHQGIQSQRCARHAQNLRTHGELLWSLKPHNPVNATLFHFRNTL